jgi:hypothetical protein
MFEGAMRRGADEAELLLGRRLRPEIGLLALPLARVGQDQRGVNESFDGEDRGTGRGRGPGCDHDLVSAVAMHADPDANRHNRRDLRGAARLGCAKAVDRLGLARRRGGHDHPVTRRVRIGEQGERFGGQERWMRGEVDQGGNPLNERGGRRTQVDLTSVGFRSAATRHVGVFLGVAFDFGSRREVADAVKDPSRAIEMRGGDGGAVGSGQPSRDARRFGDHLERGIGIGPEGVGHHVGALVGSSHAAETLRRQELHPLQQIPIGHPLDGGQGVQCEGQAAGSVAGAVEPFDAGQEMPEAVVGMAIFQLFREDVNLFR